MIELKHISKIYHDRQHNIMALHDVNLSVAKGEIFGVIGKSGAGKSTLIRCVNLLERPTTGEVIVDGDDLMRLNAKSLRQHRHQIGMVFQHFNLLESLNVFHNLALPLKLMGVETAKIKTKVQSVLDLVGLQHKINARPAQLSGGQKQRVAIARALTTDPKILLCDEMTSSLDPDTTRSVLELIKRLRRDLDLTVMMITHEMDVIKRCADRVAVLEQGHVVEQAAVVDIFRNPQHAITKQLTQMSLHSELPSSLQAKLTDTPLEDSIMLMRIAFVGQAATQPVIDDLIKHSHLEVNILQANLDYIHDETFGVLLIAVRAKSAELSKAIHYLNQKQLQVEVVGYVQHNAF